MIVVEDGRKLRLVGALRHRAQLLMMPGAHGWKNDQFFCEPTRANVEFIDANFPAAEWKAPQRDQFRKLAEVERQTLERTGGTTDYPFKTSPFKHQLDAFVRSKDLANYAYFMEMGTGKTKVLIDNAGYLWYEGKILALVVLAPNGVHRQFVTEQLKIHMSDTIMEDVDAFVYQSGGNKAFQQQKEAFLTERGRFRILAMNVEALSHSSGVDYLRRFLLSVPGKSTRPVMMAVDESTRIKNHGSKRSQNIYKLGRVVTHRRILSGSPVTRGVEDLFGQFSFLGADILGFKSFYTFRNRYCIMKDGKPQSGGGSNYKVIIGYQNIEELKARMKPWSSRVLKSECLDLPPKMYVRREVELSEVQRKLYSQLRREMLLEFENKTLTAPMAAVRLTKLQQILCGHVRFTDQGELVKIADCPRMESLKELIEEAQGQVIVWARFTPDIDRICEELADYGVSRYDGQVPQSERAYMIDAFRSGRHRIFVGQPASAGLGLNLVGPETVVYYSNSFDAEHRWQSEDRNHRAGAEGKHITYYDLVVPGSIDSYILNRLQQKKDVASMTVDDFKEMLSEEL